MAIIRKVLANSKYTKVDNMVAMNNDIPDYSFRLYVFVAGFKNGFQLRDTYIQKSLGWSRDKVRRAKRELKKASLIEMEKIDSRTYLMYIGTSYMSAQNVKDNWERYEESGNVDDAEFRTLKFQHKGVKND